MESLSSLNTKLKCSAQLLEDFLLITVQPATVPFEVLAGFLCHGPTVWSASPIYQGA